MPQLGLPSHALQEFNSLVKNKLNKLFIQNQYLVKFPRVFRIFPKMPKSHQNAATIGGLYTPMPNGSRNGTEANPTVIRAVCN
jgi:hypothetical protein